MLSKRPSGVNEMRAFIEAIVRPKSQEGTAARTAGGEAPQRPEPRPDKIKL